MLGDLPLRSRGRGPRSGGASRARSRLRSPTVSALCPAGTRRMPSNSVRPGECCRARSTAPAPGDRGRGARQQLDERALVFGEQRAAAHAHVARAAGRRADRGRPARSRARDRAPRRRTSRAEARRPLRRAGRSARAISTGSSIVGGRPKRSRNASAFVRRPEIQQRQSGRWRPRRRDGQRSRALDRRAARAQPPIQQLHGSLAPGDRRTLAQSSSRRS